MLFWTFSCEHSNEIFVILQLKGLYWNPWGCSSSVGWGKKCSTNLLAYCTEAVEHRSSTTNVSRPWHGHNNKQTPCWGHMSRQSGALTQLNNPTHPGTVTSGHAPTQCARACCTSTHTYTQLLYIHRSI